MAIKTDFNYLFATWYQERDRAVVTVYENYGEDGEKILWDVSDEDATDLIEDGFFKWKDDTSLLDYLEEIGIIEHVSEDD